MGETWIIFVAEPEEPGWENRKLPMGCLTDILDEQWDYTSSGAIPRTPIEGRPEVAGARLGKNRVSRLRGCRNPVGKKPGFEWEKKPGFLIGIWGDRSFGPTRNRVF